MMGVESFVGRALPLDELRDMAVGFIRNTKDDEREDHGFRDEYVVDGNSFFIYNTTALQDLCVEIILAEDETLRFVNGMNLDEMMNFFLFNE